MPSETHPKCPFCIENEKVVIIAQDETAYLVAALDREGVAIPGCFLIIPKAHIKSIFEFSDDWLRSVKFLLGFVPGFADGVTAYNLSFNFGEAAGQRLLDHGHMWVILREPSDTPFGLAHFVVKK